MINKIILIEIIIIAALRTAGQNSMTTLDLEKAFINQMSTSLSQIAVSISYVPLETNKDCLIDKDIKQIIISNNKILVFDYKHCYVFNANGKYDTKFIREGKGPFETIQVLDICSSDSGDKIFAVDPRVSKIIVFDKNFSPIKEFKTDFASKQIVAFNNSIAYSNMSIDYDNNSPLFNIIDSDGNLIKKFKHNRDPKLKIGLNYIPIQLYRFKNMLFYKDKWCDTLYSVNTNMKISPYMTLKLGKYKNSPNFNDMSGITGKKPENRSNLLDIYSIQELNNYLLITVTNGLFIYDKTTKKMYFQKTRDNKGKYMALSNDIDNGPEYFPKFKISDNIVASIIYPFNNGLFNEKFKSQNAWVNKLTPNDNPIIMIVKFK